jgi:hypothetical protein
MAEGRKVWPLIVELIVATAGGFLMHFARRKTNVMPHGWRELTNYSLGVAGSFPFVCLMWRGLGDEVKPAKRMFVAYLLGFLGVGAGVALGWVADTFKDEGRRTEGGRMEDESR